MDLQSLRAEIDHIDRQLLALFLRRMQIVEDVAKYKIQNNLPVLHPQREQEIIAQARRQAGEDMGDYAQTVFECLMAVSREMQETLIAKDKQN